MKNSTFRQAFVSHRHSGEQQARDESGRERDDLTNQPHGSEAQHWCRGGHQDEIERQRDDRDCADGERFKREQWNDTPQPYPCEQKIDRNPQQQAALRVELPPAEALCRHVDEEQDRQIPRKGQQCAGEKGSGSLFRASRNSSGAFFQCSQAAIVSSAVT